MCYITVMTYYSVKLNVPPSKADAIRSLVPPGEPVSGTLISILLAEASRRGFAVEDLPDATDSIWQRKIERRVKRMEDRLDAALAVVLGGGSR